MTSTHRAITRMLMDHGYHEIPGSLCKCKGRDGFFQRWKNATDQELILYIDDVGAWSIHGTIATGFASLAGLNSALNLWDNHGWDFLLNSALVGQPGATVNASV